MHGTARGAQDLAATQKAQLSQHTAATESLMGSIRVMESKLSEARSKKETLKVRAAHSSPVRDRRAFGNSVLRSAPVAG